MAPVTNAGVDLLVWLLCAVVLAAVTVAAPDPRADRGAARSWWWPPPLAASVMWFVVAVPSLLHLVVPGGLEAFRRVPVLTREGEWWRVVGSATIQDGGVAGTAVALVALAVVLVAAVRVWGWSRALVLLIAGQLLWGLWASFVWPSDGAGAWGAIAALAASLAGLWPVLGARRVTTVASAVTFGAGVLLLVADSVLGVAVLIGMLLGAVMGTVLPPAPPAMPPVSGVREKENPVGS